MARRRLRALGMLSAIGATDRNLRLVMIAGGLAVGVTAALAGAVLGLAAWFAYVPTLQHSAGHVVDASNLPWWAFAIGVVLAVATPVLALLPPGQDDRPGADRGRAVPAAPRRRSPCTAPPCPVSPCSRRASRASRSPAARPGWLAKRRPLKGARCSCSAAWSAVIVGMILLAPLAISVLAAEAGPRMPVAVRVALRDLVRYRTPPATSPRAKAFR